MKFLTRNFFQGILTLTPIFLTAYIFYLVFATVEKLGRTVLGIWIEEQAILTGLGFFVAVAAVTLAGYFSSKWFGYPFFKWIERQFLSSRVTKGIYGAIHDTLTAIMGEKKVFTNVALVTFPGLGYKMIGFITQDPVASIPGHEDSVVAYFPHSFQISGAMLVVPRKNVELLDMPAETALKMIMSAGIADR